MLAHLHNAQASLKRGNLTATHAQLTTLVERTNGCGALADRNDWIVDCGYQLEIRMLVEILLDNIAP